MTRVLLVDDDPIQLRITSEIATRAGFDTVCATGGREAISILRTDPAIGAVVLDLVMPDMDGMAVMEAMKREGFTAPVIVQTANASLETVVSAMRQGAVDYFVKPVSPERLVVSLRNAFKLEQLESSLRTERSRRDGRLGFEDFIVKSPVMDRTLALAKKAAKSTIPVLIEGESGVGKELVARVIQGTGDRAGKPFITVNCGAIPANLIESTLFGHVRGAFTGAIGDHTGKFQEAHGGTLFLDEVGELPPEAQVKLLRAVQDGEVEPVGAKKTVKVNVRLISATNRRLLNMAKAGTFREDLYYRLNVFPIYVPPLRERPEDIPLLAEHFIARFAAEAGSRMHGLTPEAMDLLMRYNWPGNVRQLENAIYRATVLAEEAWLRPADFPQIVAQTDGIREARRKTDLPPPAAPVHIDATLPVHAGPMAPDGSGKPRDRFVSERGEVTPLAEIERDLIAFALDRYDGRMSQVARALGIGRSTLYRKLKEYGLEERSDEDAA